MHLARGGQALNKKLKYAAAAIAVLAAAIYLNNTNLLARHYDGPPVLLAHRGMAQRFDERDLKNDTCTAARVGAVDSRVCQRERFGRSDTRAR